MADEMTPVEPDRSAYPRARHRILNGEFMCDGDANSECHQYPDCGGEHEYWPCGCEYVSHEQCWIKPWIDVTDLIDSYVGDTHAHLLRDADFPDGVVTTSFESDYVGWDYVISPEENTA